MAMVRRGWMLVGSLALGLAGCSGASRAGHEADARAQRQEVAYPPEQVVGDPGLEGLNDAELHAKGTAAFAAGDFALAARVFDRIIDRFPQSAHRRDALLQSGLAYERTEGWADAQARFAQLADPVHGTGDALEASFRLAEAEYHLERYPEAVRVLSALAARDDLPAGRRIEARVQQGVCELESGDAERAEGTLRQALSLYGSVSDAGEVDSYYPAQAHFFLGEIYRLNFEAAKLDPSHGADGLAKDLEHKAELLLSAQGHYLRSIRAGNGQWATASGAQVGSMYENLHAQMVNTPVPPELDAEQAEAYRQEVRSRVRVLLTKAIGIYERTLEAAERIGSENPFVERTRESLRKVKALLLADAEAQPSPAATSPQP
ncbi:tetratricopeptide repeat protein [Aggregicoccus sp. 17bor-14]|uniref:tetratricopeptide repeat protein n=1 Tax=Myxococcaceae TaxID=31 RepID=UPI00129C9B96|nr:MULTISPECIES: tetratricopeptide repeat protein [Myxococcaceae]MBF5044703.1 tetratricopeptide repeat protein [Simulacricoccus sp. 17bor-14]MRI90447.1 tetratricopeptide repeat protein [Aggregicoccus sp. 17bor-14]